MSNIFVVPVTAPRCLLQAQHCFKQAIVVLESLETTGDRSESSSNRRIDRLAGGEVEWERVEARRAEIQAAIASQLLRDASDSDGATGFGGNLEAVK